jgi:hypothetical protein
VQTASKIDAVLVRAQGAKRLSHGRVAFCLSCAEGRCP